MIYEYLDIETGEIVEITKPAAEADPVDSVIRHRGRSLRRIASGQATLALPVSDEPRARRNIPKDMPGFEQYDRRGYVVATNAELKRRGFVENPHLDNPAWK